MATAQAMFGNETWLNWAARVLELEEAPTNQTMLSYLSVVCQYVPLRSASYFSEYALTGICYALATDPFLDRQGSNYGDKPVTEALAVVMRDFFSLFQFPYAGQAALNTGAFFANDYLLSHALDAAGFGSNNSNNIYSYDPFELEAAILVASLGAIIAISVLVGLQVLAVIGLLLYIYSRPVWTKALDALAIASIGAQLLELDALPERQSPDQRPGTLGIALAPKHQLLRVWKMDGRIDPQIIHRNVGLRGDDIELLVRPPPYTPRGQQPASRAARPGDVEARGQGRMVPAIPAAPPYMRREGVLEERGASVSADGGEDRAAQRPVSPVSPPVSPLSSSPVSP